MRRRSLRRSGVFSAATALGMSFSAGLVDAGCYQRLRQTYTSHITGATASAASHAVAGMWADAARFAEAVAAFVLGLLIGATLRHVQRRQHIRSAFAAVLIVEITLLALFIAGSAQSWVSVGLLLFFAALAMGMQTVTVTRVGRLRIYTTFHTGSLSKFAEAAISYLFWAWDRTRGRFRGRLARVLRVTPRRETMQQALMSAGVWFAFLLGALAGVASVTAWGSAALVIAMLPLLWAVIVDWRKPAALGEKDPGTDME